MQEALQIHILVSIAVHVSFTFVTQAKKEVIDCSWKPVWPCSHNNECAWIHITFRNFFVFALTIYVATVKNVHKHNSEYVQNVLLSYHC